MNKNAVVGRVIALCAALFYGVNTTFSRLAYDTGATPVSLTVYRFALASALMVILALLLRKNWQLQVSRWTFVLCVLGMYATSLGHLGAVNYIPVSLAAIVFYTFPLQVIAWKRLVGRNAVNRFELIAFLLAFIGLALALGPELHSMDIRGLLLAYLGSLGATIFILNYERFPSNSDNFIASLWITLGTLVLCAGSLSVGFELTAPNQSVGWLFLGAIAVASVVSFFLSLVAIQKLGGALFALFLNFEPIIILMLAWLVLDEHLTPDRMLGMALVVTALLINHIRPTSEP